MNRHFLSGTLLGALTLLGWTEGARAQAAAKGGADADHPTFYKALHVLGDALGHGAMENVVEATGRGGVPQPTVWRIVVREGGGSREVEVTDGRITAQRPLDRPATGGTVKLAELNLDSSGAFDATDVQARKVKLRYDALNYLLRVGPASGKPVWTVDLLDQGGEKIGAIRLAAHDGTTISMDGRLANNPPPPTTVASSTPAASRAPVPTPTPRPSVVARETPRPTRRPVVTETRERTTTSTYTTTTTGRGGSTLPSPVATPPQDIPVARLSDRDEDGRTTTTTQASQEEGGGLFTRTGRTLDKTSQTVEGSFRRAGSKIQRFFTRRGGEGEETEVRDDRSNRVENPRD